MISHIFLHFSEQAARVFVIERSSTDCRKQFMRVGVGGLVLKYPRSEPAFQLSLSDFTRVMSGAFNNGRIHVLKWQCSACFKSVSEYKIFDELNVIIFNAFSKHAFDLHSGFTLWYCWTTSIIKWKSSKLSASLSPSLMWHWTTKMSKLLLLKTHKDQYIVFVHVFVCPWPSRVPLEPSVWRTNLSKQNSWNKTGAAVRRQTSVFVSEMFSRCCVIKHIGV